LFFELGGGVEYVLTTNKQVKIKVATVFDKIGRSPFSLFPFYKKGRRMGTDGDFVFAVVVCHP
jgi:hypothetical protein